jgi:hypothetical protein
VVLQRRGEFDAAVFHGLVDPLDTAASPPVLLSRFELADTRVCDIAALKIARLQALCRPR